jgi:hypothetical protein
MEKNVILEPAEFRAELLSQASGDRRVESAFRRGELLRVAHGWYASTDGWMNSAPWERLPVICTAIQLATPEACFSGPTAAQLFGLPGELRPTLVHLDRTDHQNGGLLPQTIASADGRAVVQAPRRFLHARGVPWDGEPIRAGHFRVVPPEIAAVETSLWSSFILALQVMDALLRAKKPFDVSRQDLLAVVDAWPVKVQAKRARRVLSLADARAESPMESMVRAIFILYGFEPPEIQTEFRDAAGEMRVDFYWPALRLVVEYDGEGKWTDPALETGRAQWDRIHQHNERHDRLMAQPSIHRVVHLTKEDVRDVRAFVIRMEALGIPRRPERAQFFPNTALVRV